MKHIESAIKQVISSHLGLSPSMVEITYPPKVDMGDLAVPCFEIGKKLEKPGPQIASELAETCRKANALQGLFSEIKSLGPFLNFRMSDSVLLEQVAASANPTNWQGLLPPAKTMVEFLSPNTNKPLHLGHLRNASLGDSVSRIISAAGQTVIKANLINDRGIHICKSMIAWQEWGNNQTPESSGQKGDHFVGHYYVMFEKALKAEREQWYQAKGLDRNGLNEEDRETRDQEFEGSSTWLIRAREMLLNWEAGKPEVIDLWQRMNQWVMDGFDESLSRLQVKFDKIYFESDTYKLGKNIIEDGLTRGIFARNPNGGVIFDLPEEKFGVEKSGRKKFVMVLRADGTAVYITQDIGTAVMKVEDFNLDRSLYVVASEQDHHFQCLFAIVKALGYPWADGLYHLSYGMVNLPEGRMKSREGTVVDADDLMDEMVAKAKEVILDKHPELEPNELEDRAAKIGIGAMKFFLLLSPPKNSMKYDPAASISLEGMTAPYCQYAAVRASSILQKATEAGVKADIQANQDRSAMNSSERQLARKILQLPERLKASAENLDPSTLAHHVFEIAQAFNQFYKANPILNQSGVEEWQIRTRLCLVQATQQAIINVLELLGIQTPKRM